MGKSLEISEMRALTLVQPWADCIMFHGKNVENRNWTTKLRGYIAIHASAKIHRPSFHSCNRIYSLNIESDGLSFGAILGFAELTDVIEISRITRKTEKWFEGKYGLVISEVMVIEKPVSVKGSLGFWRLNGAPLSASLEQLSRKNREKLARKLLGS